MSDFILTIAIPTFNRSDLLKECLSCLVEQIQGQVEVLVCDNASTDDTYFVCKKYENFSFFKYIKNESNIGPDGNFLNCLKYARGQYVQLLSDDDILLPGAVSRILDQITLHPGASILRVNCCSFYKSYNSTKLSAPAYSIKSSIIFNDKNDFLEFVGFSTVFMSTTIYSKNVFDSIKKPSKFIGTSLLQTHIIFECLAINSLSIIIAETCVAARVGMPVGFSLLNVLAYEWKKVLYGTCKNLGYRNNIIRSVYAKTIKNNLPGMVRDTHLTEKKYGSVFAYIFPLTWNFPVAWFVLYPYALLPITFLKLLSHIKRLLK